MEEVLLKGGDTDTNACIVGSMLGAYLGFEGLPQDKVEKVFAVDTSKGRHKRPDFLVPRKETLLPMIQQLLDYTKIISQLANEGFDPAEE